MVFEAGWIAHVPWCYNFGIRKWLAFCSQSTGLLVIYKGINQKWFVFIPNVLVSSGMGVNQKLLAICFHRYWLEMTCLFIPWWLSDIGCFLFPWILVGYDLLVYPIGNHRQWLYYLFHTYWEVRKDLVFALIGISRHWFCFCI